MSNYLTRRQFLTTSAGGALAVALGVQGTSWGAAALPQRTLGKTGARVPILGFGTAPSGERLALKDAIALYNEAIDLGVTYFDTAPEHTGYGKAQVHLGHVLKERRREVFLTTKCYEASGDKALKLLESNLKELQTGRADLVYAHSIGADPMDPTMVMGKGGVMEMLLKAKREGLARFIGVTGHSRPGRFLDIMENFDIDVMMNAVNFVDRHTYNFEEKVWPVAAKKNVGLVAMKVLGGSQGNTLSNRKMPEQYVPLAVRYALSLPQVATAVIGMATREELHHNVEMVKAFQPLTPQETAELDRLGTDMAKDWKDRFGPVVWKGSGGSGVLC